MYGTSLAYYLVTTNHQVPLERTNMKMSKKDVLEEFCDDMYFRAVKDQSYSDEEIEKVPEIARELYQGISTAHPDFTPKQVFNHWDSGKWDMEQSTST